MQLENAQNKIEAAKLLNGYDRVVMKIIMTSFAFQVTFMSHKLKNYAGSFRPKFNASVMERIHREICF